MSPLSHTAAPSPERLLERLRQSASLSRYTRAFRQATGMTLWLVGQDTTHNCEARNPFCVAISHGVGSCESCEHSHAQLVAQHGQEAVTVKCFANLRETSIPIWFGKILVGHLRTGQVFASLPTEENFNRTLAILQEAADFRKTDVPSLRQSYFAGLVVTDEHYLAIVDLLILFATQLSCELERQPTMEPPALPDAIQRVCLHLRKAFDEPFELDQIAQVAGMSPNHLCTVFKSTTGITLTEFQNRERILQAKKRLSSRYARVSEVALEVGFGSLSQFNRCFLKYAGESPTDFRSRTIPKLRTNRTRPVRRESILA